MEELQARHRKELKELQGKITSKKKNASKKTRKGVNDECDRLEHELKERQLAEIEGLAPATPMANEFDNLNLEDQEVTNGIHQAKEDQVSDRAELSPKVEDAPAELESKTRKPNRQKVRLARRAAEQEAQAEAAEKEAMNMPDQRQQELAAVKEQMTKLDLVETQIRPDGHCLYSACAHTISAENAKNYSNVRTAAANYMLNHSDDFAPFMEEPIDSYTQKIKSTAEWGGHLELQAIAKAFNVKINVLQATGRVESIQPDGSSDQEIWLAYYKHSFGLGEHYNALKKASAG